MKLLVPDWKQAPRWLSVIVATFTAVLAGLAETVPMLHDKIPQWVYVVLGTLTVIARVINQPQPAQLAPPKDPEP